MLEVEEFIGVEKWYSEDNFVRNKETGFYCIKGHDKKAEPHCLVGTKVLDSLQINQTRLMISGPKKGKSK